jgi:hypothetical protein
VRLVEVDMPQAAGVLAKIIRRLEEYQSLRAGNPRASYNDVSFAKELFSENKPDGEAASESKAGAEDVASTDEPSTAPGIEREASHDAQV